MKHFTLEPNMRAAFGGAFYPTGYSLVMFPSVEDASRIGHGLIAKGIVSGDEVYLIPAETVLAEIAPTVHASHSPLPSAGTDGDTVRAFIQLAHEGHTGLLIRTKDGAIAERYRTLVIEDL